MSAFSRTQLANGCYRYTLVEDDRFTIEPSTKTTIGGSHGSSPIFGRTSSDGGTYVTGWFVRLEGAGLLFSPGKLAECKAKLLDPAFRAWCIERAEAKGYVIRSAA